MKRLCLFAGYNHHGIISDYVVYYIKELSKLSDVYYMADCETKEEELAKLTPFVKKAYSYRHKKYDFGSWQELMWKVGRQEMAKYDELILCNDSCFAPLFPLEPIFDKAARDKNCDFFGMSKAYAISTGSWYLVSHFLFFKKQVFQSEYFQNHFDNVAIESCVSDVIEKNEVALTKNLIDMGFKAKSVSLVSGNVYNKFRAHIIDGSPLLKVKTLTTSCFDKNTENVFNLKSFLKKYGNYDIKLIENHLKNLGAYHNNSYYVFSSKGIKRILTIFRRWFFHFRWKKKSKIVRFLGKYFINDDIDNQHYRYEDGSITKL